MSSPKGFIKYSTVANFRNGLNFDKDGYGSGCLFIGVGDFGDNFAPPYEKLQEVDADAIAKEEDYLKEGDLIFVRSNGNKSLVGRSLYINQPTKCVYSGFCIRARPVSDEFSPLFLAYFSKTKFFKAQISHADGTNINNLNQTILGDVQIPVFSTTEQESITAILSSIDDKIAANNQINSKLEAMAKLIYDYWFVQFDFPISAEQAAAMGNPRLKGKPYKSSGGKMKFNEELKREIPEKWSVNTLSEIANITMGQSPPGTSYNNEGNGDVFFQGSTDFGTWYPSVRQFTTAATRFASEGDILMSVRAPVGAFNIAERDCAIGRGLAALSSKQGSPTYLFNVMGYFKQLFDLRNRAGTTFGSITKDDLFGLKVVAPPNHLIEAFEEKVGHNTALMLTNHRQNLRLAGLRDWLLPMLMNGQATVE